MPRLRRRSIFFLRFAVASNPVTLLAKKHPHSAALLRVFAPLLDAQKRLAEDLPPPELPALDRGGFLQGKPWAPASEGGDYYLDDAFVKGAPKAIAKAVTKGLPVLKEESKALASLLGKSPEACRELARLRLLGRMNKVKTWAAKNSTQESLAALFALHLAGAAARRVARQACEAELPSWSKGYCPICGEAPHATFLWGKEGQRFLQCSLCGNEWRFSRSACPSCEQPTLKELPVFFLEDRPEERAEACEVCKRYLLGLDMRGSTRDVPLELAVLCMMPLDVLMRDKGYVSTLESR